MHQAHRVTRPSLTAIVLRIVGHLLVSTAILVGLWAALVAVLLLAS